MGHTTQSQKYSLQYSHQWDCRPIQWLGQQCWKSTIMLLLSHIESRTMLSCTEWPRHAYAVQACCMLSIVHLQSEQSISFLNGCHHTPSAKRQKHDKHGRLCMLKILCKAQFFWWKVGTIWKVTGLCTTEYTINKACCIRSTAASCNITQTSWKSEDGSNLLSTRE